MVLTCDRALSDPEQNRAFHSSRDRLFGILQRSRFSSMSHQYGLRVSMTGVA
jgi:hypothetical protein